MKTIPLPIVPWETVVQLSDPLHAPTRQLLRTLKRARLPAREFASSHANAGEHGAARSTTAH
ncbi:MAG: hypothetical protein V9F00_01370 [Nocardioides sp.]